MDTVSPSSGTVTVRYFAGARAAAGRAADTVPAGPVSVLRTELLRRHDAGFARVLAAATLRSAGHPLDDMSEVAAGSVVDVLPPFAGG